MAAANDLTAQLAARQQAYALDITHRNDITSWVQQLLSAPPKLPTYGQQQIATTQPAAAPNPAADMQRIMTALQPYAAQYGTQPEIKASIDSVLAKLQQQYAATTQAGAVSPADTIRQLLGLPAAPASPAAPVGTPAMPATPSVPATSGTPATPASPAAGSTPAAVNPLTPGGPNAGGATGWLSDLLRGLTTPVTTPKPAVPVTPTAQTPGPVSGGGGASYPSYSSGGDDYAYDQPQEQPAAAPQPVAPAGPSQADYDKWVAAANTDYQYAANLRNAAAANKNAAERAVQLERAKMYEQRAADYANRVPGTQTS